MPKRSEIFDQNYENYCDQIEKVDLTAVCERLAFRVKDHTALIPFFGRTYRVSGQGILTDDNKRADYVSSVILAKYILLCPDRIHIDEEWATFRDFKKESHFTNANFFNTDTQQRISNHFANDPDRLRAACLKTGGIDTRMDTAYDLSFVFKALPRLSLLLLFNAADDEFSADCKVLFQRQAEHYLDPESLAMTSSLLAMQLIEADKQEKDKTDD